MITALTPTGARPEAFAECVRMMQAQTLRNVRWVIVDDGPEAMPVPKVNDWEVIVVRSYPLWRPGRNTQGRNILAGLAHCTDRVAIIEDDDAYAPWWLERCDEWLNSDDLVGESHALYRHLNGAEKQMNNARHASLCSTAVKGPMIDRLRQIAATKQTRIDMDLWKAGGRLYEPNPRGVTGIKGYPGRPGIGVGHRL